MKDSGIENIVFGSHDIPDYPLLNSYINNVEDIYKGSKFGKFKRTGYKERNRFLKMGPSETKQLNEYLNDKHNTNLKWSFDFFHSCTPLVLHTDYMIDKEGYEIVAGCIIPLDWNCKQPYTLNFNKVQQEPRKLMYRPDFTSKYPKAEMRYLDNKDELVDYITDGVPCPGIEKYVPKTCEMYEQMKDIEIESVYEWKIGTYMLFDTRRWHSSSWYSRFNTFEESTEDYKRSIIGFAKYK